MTRPERIRTGHWLDAPAPVRRMRPTRKHRLAIRECMLGTVYAVSPSGEARYFDYDWAAAWSWAGATPDSDIRWSLPLDRWPVSYVASGALSANPGPRSHCAWIRP